MVERSRYFREQGIAYQLDRLQSARLSPDRIRALKPLLEKYCGREFTDTEVRQAGIAIIRFTLAKQRRQTELENDRQGKTVK
jgi:hypothetical protein